MVTECRVPWRESERLIVLASLGYVSCEAKLGEDLAENAYELDGLPLQRQPMWSRYRAVITDATLTENQVPWWMRTKATSGLSRILEAVLFFAANHLGTGGCIGARIGQGLAKVEPAVECTFAITL